MKYLFLTLIFFNVNAVNVETALLQIAQEEAYIANIGSNKLSMLYGINNPIPIINRWHKLQNKKPLTNEQIRKINILENKKKNFLLKQKAK